MRPASVIAIAVLFAGVVAASAMAPLSAANATTEPSSQSAAIRVPPAASASLTAQSTSSAYPIVWGDTVDLGISVSGYPGGSCGDETLVWVLSGPTVQTVNSQTFSSGVSPNGSYSYSWTAQVGNWNYTAAMTSPGCTSVSVSGGSLSVGNSPPGITVNSIPGWIYDVLKVTWDALTNAVDQGIAQPIATVIESVGTGFAILESPWGNYLGSWGIFGPLAVVLGFGLTGMTCYAILAYVGVVRAVLGD